MVTAPLARTNPNATEANPYLSRIIFLLYFPNPRLITFFADENAISPAAVEGNGAQLWPTTKTMPTPEGRFSPLWLLRQTHDHSDQSERWSDQSETLAPARRP